MPEDLDHLIGRLRALPLDLDAEAIADVLWLAATRGGATRAPTAIEAQDEDEPTSPVSTGSRDVATVRSRERRVRITRPRGLPMPLDVARSLRAFTRRRQTGRGPRLDLDASVAGYARTGYLTPLLRPAPERWFDAVVLVDDSPSMELWRDTVTDFTAVLRQLGAFRSVRSLTLAFDGGHPWILNAAGKATNPRQLRSATARRLVIVLSDCLGDAWADRAVWRMLWEWGRTTPTALVNPLPTGLWRRTGMDLPAVRASSPVVGGASTMLRYQEPWDLVVLPGERWLPIPTPALTAQSMRRWANALMRADPVGIDAVLVAPSGRVGDGDDDPADGSSVESFRHVASDEAFRLAVLSSPHDAVSLRMLDLLRDRLVPEATVSDMAEIIAGGAAIAERDAGGTVLRVRPELREQFLRELSAPEAWRVHEILTDYVATHGGVPDDLVYAVPDPSGEATVPAELRPFVEASRSTLRLLGILPPTSVDTLDELAGLMSGIRAEDLRVVHRRTVPWAPMPEGDLADVIRSLARVDVRAGELPKQLEFAERLAARADPATAEVLRAWADSEARTRGLAGVLRRFRADITTPSVRPDRSPPPARTSSGDRLRPLVRALGALPFMGAIQDRNFLVRLLVDRLGYLSIDESPRMETHLFNIVEACDRRSDGLAALLDVVSELDGGSVELREVVRLVAERDAHDMWPEEERERLFSLLSGMIFKDFVDVYHQVAGANAPALPAETTYRAVFLTLETLNADATGIPLPILFVEYLAHGRRPELSAELRRWVDRQASRLDVITELRRLRRDFRAPAPGPAPNDPAYLVLSLRRFGLSAEQYQLSHWSQIDLAEGWHPLRGEDFVGSLDEVKRKVALLIEEVETRWAKFQPDIRIEFLLSGELLNLDVDQWPWEVESPVPSAPIGCRYSFAIRSLERMRQGAWHRSWHTRWNVLAAQLQQYGAIEEESAQRAVGVDGIRSLVADFESNKELVSLTLSAPPDGSPTGGVEVAVGVRAGVPIMVWHREDCRSEEFRMAAHEVLHGGSGDVLQRLKTLRTTAYRSPGAHVGRHMAVMWDDPRRPLANIDSPRFDAW